MRNISYKLPPIKYWVRKFRIYYRGTKILQINTYEIQIQAEFIYVFLLTHICISSLLTSKIGIFVPRSARGTRRDKKITSLESLGHNRGTKLNFYDNVNYIKIRAYLIDYQ